MKKYIFTETQIKKIIDSQLNEQYGDTDSPEDMHYVQMALNKYFKAKNIRGVWDGGYDFKFKPQFHSDYEEDNLIFVNGPIAICTLPFSVSSLLAALN